MMYVEVLLILVIGLVFLMWAYRSKRPVLLAFIAAAMVICTAGLMFYHEWKIIPSVEMAGRQIVADNWKKILQAYTPPEGFMELVNCSPDAVRDVKISSGSPAVYFFRRKDGICFLKVSKVGTDAEPQLEVCLASMSYTGNDQQTTSAGAVIGKQNGITMLSHNGRSFLATPVPDPDGLVRYAVILFDRKVPNDALLELHQKPELLKTFPGKMIHLNAVVQ